MIFGKSDWKKHCEAMQDVIGPYYKYLQIALEKHGQEMPVDRFGSRTDDSFHVPVYRSSHGTFERFMTIEEFIAHLEDKVKSSTNRADREMYYPSLSLFGVKEKKPDQPKFVPNYVILLDSNQKIPNLDFKGMIRPFYLLRYLVAKEINERGGGSFMSEDPLSKLDEFALRADFNPNLRGYMCYSVELRDRTEEEETSLSRRIKRRKDGIIDNFWELSCYELNTRLLDRFARDIGQFQRVINSKEYNSHLEGFEAQFGNAMRSLARSFATTSDPEAMIKGLAATALLGRTFQGRR